jgi:hypothetical protein
MTGGNTEAVPERKGKRKITEGNSDRTKKVKLTDLTSKPPAVAAVAAITASSAASPAPTPSPSTSGTAQSRATTSGKKKSLLGQLLNAGKVDAGRGYGLFD